VQINKRQIRVGPLQTVGNIKTELGRVYRAARKGTIDVTDASKLAQILNILRYCIEASDIEERLMALEVDNVHPLKAA
jgi:hypothetical protein